jgi:tetratricopeptide (TPR) repeat protein
LWGRNDEAIAEHELAVKYDPLNPYYVGWTGGLYCSLGHYDKALQEAMNASIIEEDYFLSYYVTGMVYLRLGKYEKAIQAHEKLVELNPEWGIPTIGYTYASSGYIEEAEEVIRELESDVDSFKALWLVYTYAALGRNDEAFKWLAYRPKFGGSAWVAVEPMGFNLHDDPRFKEFVDNLNLPD